MRIAVALGATALLFSGVSARAQAPAATSLPIGTPVTFVCEETVNSRVRPGSEFRVHLRDDLGFGTTLVATAGSPARLVVAAKDTGKDGVTHYTIALTKFSLGLAGTLPVRPNQTLVDGIATGMVIPAKTLGTVSDAGGRLRVQIPLPFALSTDPPRGGYTPVPLRTAIPLNPRRPTPRPTAAPTTAPSTAPSPEPAPS